MKWKDSCSLEELEIYDKSTEHVKKHTDITLLTKVYIVKTMVFPIVTYRCESWTIQKAECQRTDLSNCGVGEDSRVPWTAWRSNQSILKEINPEYSPGRTDAEAAAPMLWPPDMKSWLTGKHPVAGKYWGQEKGETEDEMVGWHHQLNRHEFEQTPGDREGQGSLACCSP